MAAIGDPPTSGVGFYQITNNSSGTGFDDGLNAARTNLDRTITNLSEKIDKERDTVNIDDLLTLTRAMNNLVDARMQLDD